MEQKTKDLLRDVKTELKKIYGEKLEKVILFGSYARNDHDDESDLDVFVLVNGSHSDEYDELILDMIVELTGIYGVFVSVIIKSKTEYQLQKETSPFLRNINQEGLEVYAA